MLATPMLDPGPRLLDGCLSEHVCHTGAATGRYATGRLCLAPNHLGHTLLQASDAMTPALGLIFAAAVHHLTTAQRFVFDWAVDVDLEGNAKLISGSACPRVGRLASAPRVVPEVWESWAPRGPAGNVPEFVECVPELNGTLAPMRLGIGC